MRRQTGSHHCFSAYAAEQAFQRLANTYPGTNILTVTHGGLICNVLARWLGTGPDEWREWEPHNCAITILERNDDVWWPIMVNDINHLPEDATANEDKSVYSVNEDQSVSARDG